jgi:Arm DNA-binding domain
MMAKLSDRFVASARQGEHSDDLTRGLILMVRPSTAKDPANLRRSWVLRFSRGGKRQRIGLGAYPLIGLADARQKARDALRAIDEGKDPTRAGRARLQPRLRPTSSLLAARSTSISPRSPSRTRTPRTTIRANAGRA